MVIVALVLGSIIDIALAVLLIGVSGFLFGSGPQSMHAGTPALIAFAGGVIGCLGAPVAGFLLKQRGKDTVGIILVWLPPVAALVAILLPAPY
jgi:hypothetical protein